MPPLCRYNRWLAPPRSEVACVERDMLVRVAQGPPRHSNERRLGTSEPATMRSNIEWKKWGERDPLFAVSAWTGKERGSADAWTDDQFYELGRSDWSDFAAHWENYGLDRQHCVEIGCGAGRITKHLCDYFQRVSAVDVSQHQLDYAQRHIATTNVAFFLTDGLKIPLENGVCSAAFSTHVFQHFDSHAEAYEILREIHRVLGPGRTMMIHLPVYQLPDMPIASLFRPMIKLVKRIGDVRAALNRRLLLKGKWKFVMRRLRYERAPLVGALRETGFTEIEFRAFAVRSNQDYHEFVFATKCT
jgi:ubiquinone/menaquinone biosynthesis C-methylase UbiE